MREREVEVTTEANELDDRAGTVTVSGAEVVRRLAVLAIVLDWNFDAVSFVSVFRFQATYSNGNDYGGRRDDGGGRGWSCGDDGSGRS